MRKSVKKVILAIVAVATMTSMAWAGQPKTIQFWHAMTGTNKAVLQEIADKFNQQDEYKVELIYQGHYRDLFAKLEGAAKAKKLPAMAMIFNNRLVSYVLNDFVEPLDEMMTDPKTGFTREQWEDIPQFLREVSIWNGKHYAMPFNKASYLLFYNKKMLKEKGITPPTTWEEMAAAAAALTSEDGKVYGLAFNRSVAIDGSIWVEQAGGHLYDEKTDTLTFNQEPGVKAYEFLTSMITKGHAQIAREEKYIIGPFGRGEAAMGVSSMSKLPNIIETCAANDVEFGTIVLPKGERNADLFSGTNVAIFNTCPEEDRQAAFRFLKFFLSPEMQWEWGTRSGYLPLSWKILKSDRYTNFAKANNPAKLAILPAFGWGYSDPKIINGYAIHDNMSKALDAILLESKDIKEALDEAAKRAWKEILEARKAFN